MKGSFCEYNFHDWSLIKNIYVKDGAFDVGCFRLCSRCKTLVQINEEEFDLNSDTFIEDEYFFYN
jgi:hypothetical protein